MISGKSLMYDANNPLSAYFSLKSGLEANDLGAFDMPYLLYLLGVYL
jgi:hypothetical protein